MGTNDLKILAIDDNRDNLTALQAIVADRLPGTRVLTAANSSQGLELARAEDPDVILLDIVMPGLDGYAVCRELKADERLRSIPVLFMIPPGTDRESRHKALEAGAEGFLAKPFDEAELTAQIRVMARIRAADRHRRTEQEGLADLVTQRTAQLAGELAERRRAEDALRESAAALREAQDIAGLGSYMLDIPAGRWTSSEVLDKLFGIGEAYERSVAGWQALIHPDDRAAISDYLRDEVVGQAKSFDKEYRIIRQDDRAERWVHGLGRLELDARGRPLKMHGTIQDITGRKNAEHALQEMKSFLERIINSIADPVFVKDDARRFVLVNDALCAIVGRPREGLLGQDGDDMFPADQVAVFRQMDTGVLETGAENINEETLSDLSSGEVRTIVTRKTRFVDPAGKRFLVGVIRDITKLKRLAEEKARLEDQLRQAQKVEAIGRLAGGVAHDFNNLTAIVLGYGEILLGKLPPEDPNRAYAEQIMEAGKRSAVLTRQLLAFGRKQTLQPEVLDLNALLRNFEQMLSRVTGESIELKFRLAVDLGRVVADPGQVEQVVTNLALNARDAMPLGGRLTVETLDVELDAAYAASHPGAVPGRYVMLALTDTGSGMDTATLARMFEPFFTTKPKGKGTGLGLATAFGIVKQSGGYIWADSEPGRGTTFKIYLPRTEVQAEAEAAEAGAETPLGDGELILLVEDQAPLRELCEAVLTRLGYRVAAAGNGLEALVLVREQELEPDLVLTDVIMPDMSGAEMAERLRRSRPDLRVLFMSGYTDDAIAAHGVLEPGTPFIQKPFTERALATKVRETLGGKQAAVRAARRVLMIDDDEQYRDLVGHFCTKRGHACAGAGSAAAALTALAGQNFDVLLVDLNIPGTSGERVLREIRAAGHAAPAIVLTGDVASADMGVLGPLGVTQVVEKSSDAGPLLRAIEEADYCTLE